MPEKKDNINVDEIVEKYATQDEPAAVSESKEERTPAAVYTQEQIKAAEEEIEKRPSPSHRYGKFAVSDVSRPNVSYINSVTEVRKTSADLPPKPTDLIEGYDGAVMMPQPEDETYVPRVRKMSNSTRAKEMRAMRRKKHGRRKKPDFTYAYESPDGIYTKPEKKSRKFMIHREAEEAPSAPEDDGSLISLGESADPDDLDVKITEVEMNDKEMLGARKSKKRSKQTEKKHFAIKDYDSYEDASKIRRSINVLKDNIGSRVNFLLIMLVISAYLSFSSIVGLPMPNFISPKGAPVVFCVIQLLILIFSSAMSFGTFVNGLKCLFRFRPDSDSISALAVLSSAAASAAAVFAPDMVSGGKIFLYAPIAVFCLMINAVGKKKILSRMSLNFGFISRSKDINAAACVEDSDRAESFTRGTIGEYPVLAFMKKTSFLKDFAKYTYSADTGDRFSAVVSPLVMIFSLLLGAGAALIRMNGFGADTVAYGLCIFSAAVSACSCIAVPLIANIPLEKAAKKNSRSHGVMLGYQSVEDFYDVNSIMVSAETFFPIGSVSLSSFKLFSGTRIEDALSEAASLASHGNSVLRELFSDIITGKGQGIRTVENFVCEDSMGLCGWIDNKRILFGSRELMASHKIEGIPTVTKEKEYTEGGKDALYLSVSGNLSAMFIVEITASKGVKQLCRRLAKDDIVMIVRTIDPFITVTRLASLFDYPEELIKIIPPRLVGDYNKETEPSRRTSASIACTGRFVSFMKLIMGAKAIRATVAAGVVLQSLAALSGFGLVAVNSVLNALPDVSPLHIMVYQLASVLLTSAVAKFRRVQ